MKSMQITSAAVDHLSSLLRRTSDPSPPSLPPGSRTSSALQRAARSWTDAHRRADDALHGHVQEVRVFTGRVRELDTLEP
ncbi:hypothetical protein [Corynebacterium marinum]|uniref:Uncharacterized protein n=1 Tax=Corynebacterium marinum DSM 44953 TaxID=1224162 RepID=A0A0B6TWC5_9CORY|nr:hypothetical protein [Corynebacterium marinum]AJK69840.1 hypothetical protein B840_11340 [Corynebacterium marinum DSM 44953]